MCTHLISGSLHDWHSVTLLWALLTCWAAVGLWPGGRWQGGGGTALRQNHTDHVTRHHPTGGQSLSRVHKQLSPVQGQIELCVRATSGTNIASRQEHFKYMRHFLIVAHTFQTSKMSAVPVETETNLRPVEGNTTSFTRTLSSVRVGSAPSRSTRLVCLLILTLSFILNRENHRCVRDPVSNCSIFPIAYTVYAMT